MSVEGSRRQAGQEAQDKEDLPPASWFDGAGGELTATAPARRGAGGGGGRTRLRGDSGNTGAAVRRAFEAGRQGLGFRKTVASRAVEDSGNRGAGRGPMAHDLR
jgi:hypothetical protein